MSVPWEDLVARARGLSTHLLDGAKLGELAQAGDLSDLARRLEACGLVADDGSGGTEPERLERAFRRRAADRLAVLARWCGDRVSALRIVYEDEDRKSIRALLRGLVSGAAPSSRLAGLIPTPALPLRALEELAGLDHPGKLAALLQAWGNPYGPELLQHTTGPEPDLLRAELGLARVWAARVREGARQGDRPLKDFVAEALDYENLTTALALAGQSKTAELGDWFLEGGTRLNPAALRDAVGATDSIAAADTIIATLPDCALAAVLRLQRTEPAGLDWAFLNDRIRRLTLQVRRDPLGSTPVLWFALRVRHELLSLQRILWSVSLNAPVETRMPSLDAL